MRVYELFQAMSDEYLTIDVFTSTWSDLHHTVWKGSLMDDWPWVDLEVKVIYVENDTLCIGI